MKKTLVLFLMLMMIGLLCYRGTLVIQGNRDEDVPQDFVIHFESWIYDERKNIFDTYDGYIQKDLVMNGIKKKNYIITGSDLSEIYRNIYPIKNIKQEMTSANLSKDGTSVGISPMTYYVITFCVDGITYTIKGDATASYYIDSSKEAAAFWQAKEFLSNFMYSTDVYKSMPKSDGGYD